jgi:DNA invertase Pin-like site-specific DNA recombinase
MYVGFARVSTTEQKKRQVARARGRKGGRPSVLKGVDPRNIELARRLYEENHPDYTVAALWKDLLGGISTKTFYRHIAPYSQQRTGNKGTSLF